MRRRTIVGFTVEQLINSGAYLGYGISHWDHRVRSFITGKRNLSYLFNLNCTIFHLKTALSVFFNICLKKGICSLINENLNFRRRFNTYFSLRIKKIRRLYVISNKLDRGSLTNYRLLKLRKKPFPLLPHVFFVSSPSYSDFFLIECRTLDLPTISITDSAYFSLNISYPIPSSEKSFKVILMYNTLFYLYFIRAYLVRSNMFHAGISARSLNAFKKRVLV